MEFNKFKKIIKNKKVYLTFDVDGLDSKFNACNRNTRTRWFILGWNNKYYKNCSSISDIVGADVNELSPIKGFNSYNFLAAKLVYKIISYSFEFKKKIR